MSLRIPFFASITPSGTASSLSSQPHPSFIAIHSPSLSSSGCTSRVSWMTAVSMFPVISSITPFMVDSNVTSTVITFVSLLHFHLCWPVPSFSYPFLQNCHMGIPLGDEATQLHALLSVRELTNRCTVTNHWQTWWHDWLLIMMDPLYTVISDWRASSQVCTWCSYSQYSMVTKIWACCWETGII